MKTHKVGALEINGKNFKFDYNGDIDNALEQAAWEVQVLNETIESVQKLKPDCDKLDYTLAACSGALCGIIDIFLVGKPGESPLGKITDKWFENRTCDFAKLCGWPGSKSDNPLSSAMRYLENRFDVPYDQRGCGDAGSSIFGLDPTNHHFKSLGHNPSLVGLFFSILDQFRNTSHFVSNGQMIELVEADDKFKLQGNNIYAKFLCGFVNWFCHIMSDVSGASGSKGRGMGIPSPLWTWTNDVIAIKSSLGISTNQFDRDVCDLALNMYEEGFDLRFQTTQAIPVLINEAIVRLFYSVRRMIRYYKVTNKNERSFKGLWKACEPFSNATVKRMLTVAHGTFCLVDAADATLQGFVSGGGNFNPLEFFLRLNVAGIGRFTICLYGEAKQAYKIHKAEKKAAFAIKERKLLEKYIEGLNKLKDLYDDEEYLTLVDDLRNDQYIIAFMKSVSLAHLRGVKEVLETKQDIDEYFTRRQ